jgi:hypothetical protein
VGIIPGAVSSTFYVFKGLLLIEIDQDSVGRTKYGIIVYLNLSHSVVPVSCPLPTFSIEG